MVVVQGYRKQIVLALVIVACGSLCVAADEKTHVYPTSAWKLANSWHITVERYPRDKDKHVANGKKTDSARGAKARDQYDIHVVVLPGQKIGTANCWRVNYFIAAPEPPRGLVQYYRLFIGKEDGQPYQVVQGPEKIVPLIDKIGGFNLIMGAPEGYPVEILPLAGPLEIKSEGSAVSWKLNKEVSGKQIVQEAIRKGPEGEIIIRQKWIAGEPFWREYERYYNGHLDLKAKFVKDYTPPPIAPKPPPTAEEKAQPVTELGLASLAGDSRVQVKLNLDVDNPTLAGLFDRLQEVTGLVLKADNSFAKDQPVYGKLSIRNLSAWEFMEQIAEAATVRGRWEKTNEGYELHRTGPAPPWWHERSRPLLVGAAALALLLAGYFIGRFVALPRQK